jgi:diphosphomevalonate decarboxylase
MQWFAQAPANIALIKYMGKIEDTKNLPINSSLSYTLNNLLSSVQLVMQPGRIDFWEPLNSPGTVEFKLPIEAQQRFLNHLSMLKHHFDHQGAFIVRSNNNFPHSSGLASSASSFAALTKCAVLALSELTGQPLPSIEAQAQLSRVGSGSSCRSFFSPWALWKGEEVHDIDLPYRDLIHQVVVISHAQKQVPSSEAHVRIRTSKLFTTRAERAEQNLKALLNEFENKDWADAYKICWREFHDLHQLFATSEPPFAYITAEGEEVLAAVQRLWEQEGDGPIATMDAGPNIHLLYRPEQAELALRFKHDHLVGNFDVL